MYLPEIGLLASIRFKRGNVRVLKPKDKTSYTYKIDHADADERFRDGTENEPAVCKHFGCGKHLSLEESKYGDRCREHSVERETDIMMRIKME